MYQTELMRSDIYLETCPLWRSEWKCGTYSSHNTTGGSMRLILPNRNNVLHSMHQKTWSVHMVEYFNNSA